MENIIKEETYKNYTIRIVSDEESANFMDNPIEMCECNEKTTFFSNQRCNSYKHSLSEIVDNCDDFDEYMSEHYTHYLPIYGYSHGGMELSLSNESYPFNCPFDGFLYGVITTNETNITKEEFTKTISSYIKEFNDLSNGEIYGYQIIDKNNEETDSCYGFVGESSIADMIEDCKSIIDGYKK